MELGKGDLITIDPLPLEDIISGQQVLSGFIREDLYLGVVTKLNGSLTEVIWLRHPTNKHRIVSVQSRLLKKATND